MQKYAAAGQSAPRTMIKYRRISNGCPSEQAVRPASKAISRIIAISTWSPAPTG
jgi:hypothetical protein